jgi:hypothetical protein
MEKEEKEKLQKEKSTQTEKQPLDKADKALFNSLIKKASKPLQPQKKTKD